MHRLQSAAQPAQTKSVVAKKVRKTSASREKITRTYRPEQFIVPLGKGVARHLSTIDASPSSSTASQPPSGTSADTTIFTVVASPRRRISPDSVIGSASHQATADVAPIPLSNRFASLSTDDVTEQMDSTPTANPTTAPTAPKVQKPPPIFIYGIKNTYGFIKSLAATVKEPPVIQQNKERIKFQLLNRADFDKIKTYCDQQQIEYATGITRGERPVKVVIRKLPLDTDISDLSAELTGLGYTPLTIRQMTKKGTSSERVPMPLYLVSLARSPETKGIYSLTHILHYRIQVEPYRPPGVLQCFRCQRMGHSQDTCQALPRCVKCGQGHFTKACTKPSGDAAQTPATCANCAGAHPANFRGCPAFKAYQAARQTAPTAQRLGGEVPSGPVTTVSATASSADLTSSTPSYAATAHSGSRSRQRPPASAPLSAGASADPTRSPPVEPVSDIKMVLDFLKGINLAKIVPHIKRGITRFRQASDLASKAAAFIETVTEMIDDGCF